MRLLLLTILLFINSISFSQQNTINLKSGQHEIEYNFDILNQNEKYYRYVLFSEIPSTEQITQLKDIGINLLEYLPKNMYICSIDKYILPYQHEKFNVISLNKILPSFKIDKIALIVECLPLVPTTDIALILSCGFPNFSQRILIRSRLRSISLGCSFCKRLTIF